MSSLGHRHTICVMLCDAVWRIIPAPMMTVKTSIVHRRPSFSPTKRVMMAPAKHPRSYTEVTNPCIAGEGWLKYSIKSWPTMMPPKTPGGEVSFCRTCDEQLCHLTLFVSKQHHHLQHEHQQSHNAGNVDRSATYRTSGDGDGSV
jgi:hypothetical protein